MKGAFGIPRGFLSSEKMDFGFEAIANEGAIERSADYESLRKESSFF